MLIKASYLRNGGEVDSFKGTKDRWRNLKKRFGVAASKVKNSWVRDVACWLIRVG